MNTEPIIRKTYRSLTYIEGVSEKIATIARSFSTETIIAYKSNTNLRNVFSKLKEKIPLNQKTNVIYEIPCLGTGETNSRCSLSYVGQTKQFLENRIKNHKNDLRKTYDISLQKTAVVEHFHTLGHYPDFKNTRILGTQRHYNKRLTTEALHIYTHNTYNVRRDVQDIAPVYCAIMDENTQSRKRKNITHTMIDYDRKSKKRRLN